MTIGIAKDADSIISGLNNKADLDLQNADTSSFSTKEYVDTNIIETNEKVEEVDSKFNTEYLVLCNRGFSLQDANLTIISLNTGKEVKENKAKIYKEVNKVNKYGSFEVKSFPKR